MSIEEQLRKAFKQSESSLHCPSSLDAVIMADYEGLSMGRGRNVHMMKKRKMPKIAVIALIAVLLCGFAYGSKLIFSDSTSQLTFQFQSNDSYYLDNQTLESTRAALSEVQSQLAPGETAIVYLPDVIKGYPILSVTNVDYIYDINQWQQVLKEQGVREQLPLSLLNGAYQFESGALNNPFYPLIGWDYEVLIEEMEAEKKAANTDKILWRLTDVSSNAAMSSYSSVYRDTAGEAIQLSWQIYSNSAFKIEAFTSPSTQYEEYSINDKKVHYTKNDQALRGESNVLQTAMWMTEVDGTSIVYNVASDSLSLTKERLIEVVKSLP